MPEPQQTNTLAFPGPHPPSSKFCASSSTASNSNSSVNEATRNCTLACTWTTYPRLVPHCGGSCLLSLIVNSHQVAVRASSRRVLDQCRTTSPPPSCDPRVDSELEFHHVLRVAHAGTNTASPTPPPSLPLSRPLVSVEQLQSGRTE